MADAAFSAVYTLFAILAVPSLLTLLNVLTISVRERTRKIAMIRTVGGTRKQILNIVLVEAILLAAIVIAAIIPARQAARLEIIQALRYG